MKSLRRGLSTKSLRKDNDSIYLCDRTVEFLGTDESININGTELAEFSEYFDKLFKYNKACKLVLNEEFRSSFEPVIKFIRENEVDINGDNAVDLFITADYLGIENLRQQCIKFIHSRAVKDPVTALNLWLNYQSLVWDELADWAFEKVIENCEQVFQTEEFLKISVTDFLKILSNDHLNVYSEYSLLEVIAKWHQKNKNEQASAVKRLLECVRVNMLTDLEQEAFKNHPLVLELKVIPQVLPQARLPHEMILVFGGWCDGAGPKAATQIFNPKSNHWSLFTTTSTPVEGSTIGQVPPRVYGGCTVFDNKVFIVGGFDGENALKTTLCYDFETDTGWNLCGQMHEKRYYVSVTKCGSAIYAIGGHNGENQGRLKTAERYIVAKNQWERIPPMYFVRSDASATSLKDKVYVIGGFEGRRYHNSAECFDPEANEWTNLTQMHFPRGGVCAVVYGNHIYAIGGNDGSRRLRSVERYDTELKRWQMHGQLNRAKSNMSAVVMNDCAYVIGGWSDEQEAGILDAVEKFNLKTMTSEMQTDLCFAASATAACTFGGKRNVQKYA